VDIQKRVIVKCFICEKEGVASPFRADLFLLPPKWKSGVVLVNGVGEEPDSFAHFMLCRQCADKKDFIN
jgi:hypothetical protein